MCAINEKVRFPKRHILKNEMFEREDNCLQLILLLYLVRPMSSVASGILIVQQREPKRRERFLLFFDNKDLAS